MTRAEVFALIEAERERQNDKWGGHHHWGQGDCSSAYVPPLVKASVLGEEYGEICRALLDGKEADLRRELVQLAAVATAWLEGME